jgi:hypothetical protein
MRPGENHGQRQEEPRDHPHLHVDPERLGGSQEHGLELQRPGQELDDPVREVEGGEKPEADGHHAPDDALPELRQMLEERHPLSGGLGHRSLTNPVRK